MDGPAALQCPSRPDPLLEASEEIVTLGDVVIVESTFVVGRDPSGGQNATG